MNHCQVGGFGAIAPGCDSDNEPVAVSGLTGHNGALTPMAERLSERVLMRIREEIGRRDWSQRDVAGMLNTNQSRVNKLLNGRIAMNIDDLEEFCTALQLSATEIVRDRGLEFCADMTPTELRLLEQMRREPSKFTAVLALFEVRTKTNKPERYAGSVTDKKPTRR